ncbi:unnamed protein product [Orchesella dallaii]|uniref:Down syndrome cell adhesion molecule-like protein Dscam2 n=1 Tax=Orchesella dallaii TaxID=48710 RepID=A0ABP1RJD7_9HEXA
MGIGYLTLKLILCLSVFGKTSTIELNGPELERIPAPVTYFSNAVGLMLSCVGRGPPPLTISWLSEAGEKLEEIPGTRMQLPNGSLHFSPFNPHDYISTLHTGDYRCSVKNPVGTYLSPKFGVRAIVDHQFEVRISLIGVSSDLIMQGNPALLSCDIYPSIYTKFVRIIAWKTIDPFGHKTDIMENDNRYNLMADGSLLIYKTKFQQLFVCVGESNLDKMIQTSREFLLTTQVGGGIGVNLNPVILKIRKSAEERVHGIIPVDRDFTDLVCLAVGSPSPNYSWEKYHKGKFVPVTSILHTSVEIQGPLLRIHNTSPSAQNGTYRCTVKNTIRTFTSDYHFLLENPPVLLIEPRRKLVRNGDSFELKCALQTAMPSEYGTFNISSRNIELKWYKDGEILNGNHGLTNSPIHSEFQIFHATLEDQGVYQCFVDLVNSDGVSHSIQAAANVVFESSAPELVNTFISQSIQPGPLVSLKCSAIGNPIPRITWSIDGLLISPQEQILHYSQTYYSRVSVASYQQRNGEIVSHLNISTVQVEDSGVYKCEASNLVGNSSHSTRLNIYGRISVKEMSSLTIVAGQNALIPCHYGGYPVDNIKWLKGSEEFEANPENNGKDGSENRFTVFANGTLQIERTNKDSDSGLYTCKISNRKGEIASGSVNVNVMHPPVISPIRFDEDLKEGQRTSAFCNVISGDLPIDIVWFKDSLPISDWLNITETRAKFLSVLIFEELYHEHSGKYTCSVTNAAAMVTQSAKLIVKVPPKWTRKPDDTKVVVESDHLIICLASGVPTPNITWFREFGTGGEKHKIISNDKFHLLQDGSLKILGVDETDVATYICEASNGVGIGISKSIRLDVIIPAKISALMTSLVVAEGLGTTLKCEIRGDSPIQVSWKKDSIFIESEQSPSRSAASSESSRFVQHQRIVEGNSSVLSAELRIDPTEKTDSGLYLCLASNQYGRDEARINLEVKARPSPPENFMVKEIGSRFISLSWSLKSSDSLEIPVTHFVLQWKKSSTVSWESLQVYNKSVESYFTSVVIDSLNPITNYDVRLIASNEFGSSLPTQILTIITLAEAPSGSPRNVSGVSLGPKVAIIKWEPPDPTLQNGEILGYQIMANSNYGHHTAVTVDVDDNLELQAELRDLMPNSQYRFSIKAYNREGVGPPSAPIFIPTPEGAPDSPPLHLNCEAVSPKSLQVQWDPPPVHLSNGQILGYKVIYFSVDVEKNGEKGEVKKTSNRATTLHGLKSFMNYSIKALAYTLGGESNMSEPVICRTEEDVPEEPADLKVALLSATSALVSWLRPRHSNGIITKYTVFWKAEDSEQMKEKSVFISDAGEEEDEFFQEIRRLKDSTKYSIWVKASTSIGIGRASHIENLIVDLHIPARIASFPVVRNTEIGKHCRLPCRTAGTPSPKVLWFKNNVALAAQGLLKNGSLLISRVKDADEGVYTCRAENEHGSDEIEHRIIIKRRPSSIQIFVGYVTHSSIQIHWDPLENIEPPLTAYSLQYQLQKKQSLKQEEWNTLRLSPRLASYLLENLLCGTQHLFRIFGENSVGKGEPSQQISVRTGGKEPEIPKLTEILDGNGTMIRIDLTRWSDGGCPIINYNIQYKRESSENWNRIYKKDNSTRVFVIQTQLFSKYEIKIRMENDAGSVTKVFRVESHSDFFTNYAKVLERVEEEVRMNGSYVSLYTDPHVLVPIVSAIICPFAVAICALMLIKRKNQSQTERKFKENRGTTHQKTWLSGSADGMSKFGVLEHSSQCPEPMSVYATLNSNQQIPMTIRDATVRFQSLGQHENNEAPPSEMMTGGYLKTNRRKSFASSPLEETCIQRVSCQMEIEPPTGFRSSSSSTSISQGFHHRGNLVVHKDHHHAGLDYNEILTKPRLSGAPNDDGEEENGLFHDYSSPYQYKGQHNPTKNTLKKQVSTKSVNKSRSSRDCDDYF